MRGLAKQHGYTLLTSRIYHRKIIQPEDEQEEFRDIFRNIPARRLALDRHFYYFTWKIR